MKPFNLYKALLFAIIPFIAFPVLAQSGSYTLTPGDLGNLISISVPANVPIKITYIYNQNISVDIFTEYDEYCGDGPDSGQFTTVTPSGYINIYCGDEGNGGPYSLTLNWIAGSYSATQDSYIHGNSVVDGNLSIGGLSSSGKLGISGGDKLFSLYSYNYNQSPGGSYGIFNNTSNNSGPAYGVYSYVSGGGPANQRWAGYFYGGDVDVNNGNLKVYGAGKVRIGTNTAPTQALSVTGRVAIAPSGITSDEGYNGALMITKPTASGQYINLVRSGIVPWSIGTVYNSSTFGIGIGTPSDASFTNPLFTIEPNGGKIGIGTSSPTTKLHVAAVSGEGIRIGKINDTGNLAVPVGALAAQYNIDFSGYRDMSIDQIGARISALRFNCHIANSALVQKTGLAFYTNPSGINTGTTDLLERMRITPEGKIGIGTDSPDELLTVKGIIHAREVKVDLNGPLADFVFKHSYKLMPLHEVEQFVKTNNHLPEIPSAAEVSKNGLNMGEMQNKLLQKIEELTLYVIEQQKTNNQQSAKIEELERRLK